MIHKTGFRRAGHILQYALYLDSIEIFICIIDEQVFDIIASDSKHNLMSQVRLSVTHTIIIAVYLRILYNL